MSGVLKQALLGELAREPQTAEVLATKVAYPLGFVRSALSELAQQRLVDAHGLKGVWAPVQPPQKTA
jgi:hypothetical protein